MPIMEPPGGDWMESCCAAAWTVWKAPERFVERVWDQRSGVILCHFCYLCGSLQGEMV